MRNIFNDESGNLNSLLQLGMVVVIVGVVGTFGLYLNEKTSDKTALTDLTSADILISLANNSVNFTDDARLNVTNHTGVTAKFYLNLTANGNLPYGDYEININGTNAAATANLTTNLTNNITVNRSFTVTNPTANTVKLTRITKGTTGNTNIDISENDANFSTTTTLGTNRDTYYNSSTDVTDTIETGWSFMSIIMLVAAAVVILTLLFGVFGGYMRF